MAKKEVVTKQEKGMVIYLKDDAIITKVEEGTEIIKDIDCDYIIVAEVINNENHLKIYDYKLRLYNNLIVSPSLFTAFAYTCRSPRDNFLTKMEALRENFLAKIEKFYRLSGEDKLEIKKFIYATFIQAKKELETK